MIEFAALLATLIVFLICLMVQGGATAAAHGLTWGFGPRDEPKPPTVLQGRMTRIVQNSIESLTMFVPLALMAHALELSNPTTQLAALMFAGSRAAFALIYALGIPYLRTLAWGVGLIGIIMLIGQLLPILC